MEGFTGLRRRLFSLHAYFYLTLLGIVGVLMAWPTRRMLYLIGFTLYSPWVPQIVYSAYSGTRNALHPYYLVGMPIIRLFLPLYMFGCPNNLLNALSDHLNLYTDMFHRGGANIAVTSDAVCAWLILWTAFQLTVIHLQNKRGARFFVPKYFLPVQYSYQRPIPAALLQRTAGEDRGGPQSRATTGNNLSSQQQLSQRSSVLVEEQDERGIEMTSLLLQSPSTASIECVICYNPIEFSAGEDYMLTPCDHLFHGECLTRWTEVKLECPVCRCPLPPTLDP